MSSTVGQLSVGQGSESPLLPEIKEYSLHHGMKPLIVEGTFLN